METFNFDDVMLVPKKCQLSTRAHATVSAKLGPREFRIPVMASNMPTILDEDLCLELARRGYFYVMHRYNQTSNADFIAKAHSLGLYASISVGILEQYHDEVEELARLGLVPDYINIEIAHGHAETIKDMIDHVRRLFGDKTFIIAGNVGTPEGLRDLESWGADAVRVGIGPGYACTTSIRTGFGTRGWQLCAIAECAKVKTKVLIADGGFRTSGDVVKALHFGADWALSGYLYAGCKPEAASKDAEKVAAKDSGSALTNGHGAVACNGVTQGGKEYHMYYGNASFQNKGVRSRIEGRTLPIAVADSTLWEKLVDIEEDLQSAVSYAGGNKIEDVRNVEHVFLKRPLSEA